MIERNKSLIHFLKTILLLIFCHFLALGLATCGPTSTPTYSISGRVTSGGSGLAGVSITLSGGGSTQTTTTDNNGDYQFFNKAAGSYVITPSKAGYAFTPATRTAVVSNANVSGEDFLATPVNWAKTYGGVNREIAYAIQQTSDDGFIIAGETYSFGVVNADVWVLKIDANGNIQWQKTFGGIGFDVARSVQQTLDGGFIVAGETSSFGSNTEVWVLKLNANGAIQWQYRYGGSGDDVAHSIARASDGGYIVAGETTSFEADGVDVWVLKLDANGGIVWQKTYGGSNDDIAYSVKQTSDNKYIIAGETNSFGVVDRDYWVLKLDSDGSILWQKIYGGNNYEVARSIEEAADGGIIVAGESASFGSGLADFWVLKLDSNNGNVLWEKIYSVVQINDDVTRSIQKTSDGGFIVAGNSTSFGNPLGDIWILKLKANGDIDWQKSYGGSGSNSASMIRQIGDGGYILAGYTSYYGAGDGDMWVLKLDGNGSIGSGCGIITATNAPATNTSATVRTPSVSVNNTNATAIPISVTAIDSGANINTQCSYP